MDFDPLCRFLYFCGQPVVAVILIEGSKTSKLLLEVELPSLYAIEKRSKVVPNEGKKSSPG